MKPDNRKNSLDMPDFLVVQALLLFSLVLSVQTVIPKQRQSHAAAAVKPSALRLLLFALKKKK